MFCNMFYQRVMVRIRISVVHYLRYQVICIGVETHRSRIESLKLIPIHLNSADILFDIVFVSMEKLPQMNVMLDFICIGSNNLRVVQSKRTLLTEKFSQTFGFEPTIS